MSVIYFLFLSISFIYAQNFQSIQTEFPNEYIRFLQKQTLDELSELNQKWILSSTDERLSLPFKFTGDRTFTIKKSFFLDNKFKGLNNFLCINGIQDNAIIRLNAQVIFSYKLNGMPVEIKLDPTKLYFGQKNELEIEITHQRNFSESIPRKAIRNEAKSYGGIGDVYLRHKKTEQLHNITLQNSLLSFQLKNLNKDSLSFYSYRYQIKILNTQFDSIAAFTKNIKRFAQKNDSVSLFLGSKRKPFHYSDNFYIDISSFRWNRKKAEWLKAKRQFFSKKIETVEHERIIAKVDQHKNGSPFLSMERMEDDVRLIKRIGFNAIYFPYAFPHPFYDYLAKNYQLKIYVSDPFFSAPSEIKTSQKNQAYLKNIHLYNNSSFAFVSSDLFQKTLLFPNGNEKELTVIQGLPAIYENYSGYLNANNEESQAKYFLDQVSENLDRKDLLISYFTDYITENPRLSRLENNDAFLSQSGIMTLDRKEKKSFRLLKALFHSEQYEALNPGTKIIKENYAFIIFGLISFAIFVIGFKQATRLADNLKRSFFHAHGFFSDTRDRRILYMGQSSFIAMLTLFNLANISAAYLFFNRGSEFLASLINYLFDDSLKIFFVNLFSDALSTQIFMFLFITLILLFFLLALKLISYFGKRKANFRQLLTVLVWASNPLLFLIPISLFFYNALVSQFYPTVIYYGIALFIFWSLIRIVNGVRVIIDTSRIRVYAVLLFSFILLCGLIWLYLEYNYAFSDYMMYFAQLMIV